MKFGEPTMSKLSINTTGASASRRAAEPAISRSQEYVGRDGRVLTVATQTLVETLPFEDLEMFGLAPKPPAPEVLSDDAAAARLSSAALATAARAVAEKELAGLRAEAALTQRFRAPQTLAVLRAARAVVEQADGFLPSSKREAMRELLELLDAGLAEAGPMVAAEEEEDEDYV